MQGREGLQRREGRVRACVNEKGRRLVVGECSEGMSGREDQDSSEIILEASLAAVGEGRGEVGRRGGWSNNA